MTIRAISRRMIGIIIPTRKVVLSGSVVISADHLDSLNISLVVYALILNLLIVNEMNRLISYAYQCILWQLTLRLIMFYFLTYILYQVSKVHCNNLAGIDIFEYQRWSEYWSSYWMGRTNQMPDMVAKVEIVALLAILVM